MTADPEVPAGESPRISLCLAGGGYSGALFEFGALAALDRVLVGWSSRNAAVIVGTSAGAVVGAVVAMGLEAGEIRRALEADGKHPIRFGRRDFSGVPWTRHAGTAMRVLAAIPRLLVRHAASPRSPALNLADDLRPLLPLGLFTSEGLEKLLDRVAGVTGSTGCFRDLVVPLVLTATDLDTGERVVFGSGWDESPPVAQAVRASAAIPVYFEPIRIGQRTLIDGQIVDPVHLDLAAVGGARVVIAISSLVPYRRGHSGSRIRDLGAPAVMDQSGRVAAAVKLRATRKRFEEEHPDIACVFVEPRPEEVETLLETDFRPESMMRAWELGYRVAVRTLEGLGEEPPHHPALSGIRIDPEAGRLPASE